MRYPAAEKLEIIRLVEQSHLPVRETLARLGIPRPTFYAWVARYREGGPEALADRPSKPDRVWNRIDDATREKIIELALEQPTLSPRELAVTFTDTQSYFVSEASVYRLLKAHDLITSPAFIVIKAADEFKAKTTAPNQLWPTDFTYLKVIGWGWLYLSTILDDYSRYIIAWKLCTTMQVEDVTDTLNMALEASGCATAKVSHQPRLLSDNGPCYFVVTIDDAAVQAGLAGLSELLADQAPPQISGQRFTILSQRRCDTNIGRDGKSWLSRGSPAYVEIRRPGPISVPPA